MSSAQSKHGRERNATKTFDEIGEGCEKVCVEPNYANAAIKMALNSSLTMTEDGDWPSTPSTGILCGPVLGIAYGAMLRRGAYEGHDSWSDGRPIFKGLVSESVHRQLGRNETFEHLLRKEDRDKPFAPLWAIQILEGFCLIISDTPRHDFVNGEWIQRSKEDDYRAWECACYEDFIGLHEDMEKCGCVIRTRRSPMMPESFPDWVS